MLKTSTDPEFQDWEKKRRQGLVRARWQFAMMICASLLMIFVVPALLSRYRNDSGEMMRWAEIATWISYLAGGVLYILSLYRLWRGLKARF